MARHPRRTSAALHPALHRRHARRRPKTTGHVRPHDVHRAVAESRHLARTRTMRVTRTGRSKSTPTRLALCLVSVSRWFGRGARRRRGAGGAGRVASVGSARYRRSRSRRNASLQASQTLSVWPTGPAHSSAVRGWSGRGFSRRHCRTSGRTRRGRGRGAVTAVKPGPAPGHRGARRAARSRSWSPNGRRRRSS